MLIGIAFDQDGDVRFGLEAPHHVHQIAGVRGEQFETKLMVAVTRGKRIAVVAGPKIDKMCFNILRRFPIHCSVHVRVGDQETVGGQSRDRSFGNAKLGQGNVHTPLAGGL
jgi:hypothetical protein